MSSENTLLSRDRAPARAERVDLKRLLWAGPLVVVAAIAANVVFGLIVTRLFGISPDFPALSSGALAVFTAVLVTAAVIVFALVARFARRPITTYRKIALGALLLSFLPDFAMPFLPGPVPIGILEIVLLMITHLIAAAVAVGLLERFARER